MDDHYHFDFPLPADFLALTHIWEHSFGETREDAHFFLKNRFRPGETLILRNTNGSPVAMMTLIPARLNDVPGAYIYAVATHEDYRSQGLMRTLHAEAVRYLKTQGVRFTCLAPASESLFSLYEELGYKTRFYRRQHALSNVTPCPFMDLHIPTLVDFTAMRAEYLQRRPYRLRLLCPDYLLQELRHYGGDAVCFPVDDDTMGYAAYTLNGSTLHVRECNVPFTAKLASSLLAYTGCRRILLDSPEKGDPVGMYRPIGEDPFPKDFTASMSLCLDC